MPSSLGPAEILVILVIALIVLGPSRLPEAGRQVGKALTEIRRWTQDVRSEMTGAFQPEPPTASMPTNAPIFDPMPEPQPIPSPAPSADPASAPRLEDAPTAPIEEALIRPGPEPETSAGQPASGDAASAPPSATEVELAPDEANGAPAAPAAASLPATETEKSEAPADSR